MAYNFRACDRDQAFLLPPDVREWLAADHLAWFVLDVVDQLDLGPFLAAYRADGHGRCTEDIAFRVLAGISTPDHVTIARFRSATNEPWPDCWSPRCSCAPAAGMRPPTPRPRSTPPTLTAASCTATAGLCRATTPKTPPPASKSWSRLS
jgi:hypothetical protein